MAKATSTSSSNKKSSQKRKIPTPTSSRSPKALRKVNSDTASRSEAPTQEDRERMIQYAAYHIAEKDGFQSGKEQDYWFEAEQQITDLFKAQPSENRRPRSRMN